MRDVIIKKLKEIEERENAVILHAVESGSRAWGFQSPDSDYDVRFIYVRPPEFYLQLRDGRDVLEYPCDGVLDINGWDLKKALRLLHASNPVLFEWCQSPVVYKTTEIFKGFMPVFAEYFSLTAGMWHYIHMAKTNYRDYLKGELVRAKKYLYVIRPILACRWILERRSPPPVLFSELAAAVLEPEFKPDVDELLRFKMSVPEMEKMPRIEAVNAFIEENITCLQAGLEKLPKPDDRDWKQLDGLFLSALKMAF